MNDGALRKNPSVKIGVMQVMTRMNVGGITQQILLISEQLREQGYDVTLAGGQCGPTEGDCRGDAVRQGFRVHEIPHLSNNSGPIGDMRACLSMYRLFRRERPALVHLYMFKARVLGSFAARLAGVPIVIETLHGNVLEGYYGKVATLIILLAERIVGWLLAHCVISPSESQRTELLRYRVAPDRKLLVQRVGFDVEAFRGLEEFRGQLRKALGVGPDTLLVGVIARLVPIKGIGDFLEAASLLSGIARQEKMSFVVVGDGPQRGELEQRAKTLGLDGSCRFLGRTDDARSLFADADVFVLSSWNEGTPISLLEAMASSKAIVATRVGSVAEMVEDGVSALLVPRRNPQALADAIAKFAEDPVMRARCGREAKVRAQGFSVSALRESLHALYQRMLREQRSG